MLKAMKIGVLSDTHLNQVTPALEKIMAECFRDIDLLIHAGDMVGLAVYRFLTALPLEAVQGNMDEFPLRKELPYKKTLHLGGFRIGLLHGWGSALGLEERVRREFPEADAIVYGHSHIPANHWSGGQFFFNPGSTFGSGRRPTVGLLQLGSQLTGEIIEC
jgi:putative phosphoesterase